MSRHCYAIKHYREQLVRLKRLIRCRLRDKQLLWRDVRWSSTGDKCLLLEYQRRSAYSLPFEVDYHFDAVGDLHQGDAFVHAVVLAVEGHRSFKLA
jgi:hypothetical protein